MEDLKKYILHKNFFAITNVLLSSVLAPSTVKVLLLVGTNFRGFYKIHWSMGSWIRGFKRYRQQSM